MFLRASIPRDFIQTVTDNVVGREVMVLVYPHTPYVWVDTDDLAAADAPVVDPSKGKEDTNGSTI